MNFYIMTLFPDMVMQGLNTSIIGRAAEKGLLTIKAVNIRDYTINKHKKVDDYPYGGGGGAPSRSMLRGDRSSIKSGQNRVQFTSHRRDRLLHSRQQSHLQKKKI